MNRNFRPLIAATVSALVLSGLSGVVRAETVNERLQTVEQENKELKERVGKLEKDKSTAPADFTKEDKDTLGFLKDFQKHIQPFGSIGVRYHGFYYIDPGFNNGVNFKGKNVQFSRGDAQMRLGVKGEVVPGLNYLVRLSMADPNKPSSGWPQFGDFFNRKPIEVDRYYLDWRPPSASWFHGLVGKFQNPIQQTQLVWDSDVGISGVMADIDFAQMAKNDFVKKASVGPLFYYLSSGTGELSSNVYAVGGALQSQFAVTKAFNFIFNLAYYDYHNADGIAQAEGNSTIQGPQGNQQTSNLTPLGPVLPGVATANTLIGQGFASDFNLINPYVEMNGNAPIPWKIYVDQVYNFGAAGPGRGHNYGVYAGTKIGGTGQQWSPWVQYDYYWIEADATLDVYSEDEFGTNATGHRIGAGITLAKNVNLLTTCTFFKEVDPRLRGFGDTLGSLIPGINVPIQENLWMVRPRVYLTVNF